MTILIGVALRDFVVLLADERQINSLEAGAADRTDPKKIVALRENLVLGIAGAQLATDMAVAELRQFAPALAPNLLSQLKRLAFSGASHVQEPPVAVALLAAGFDAHGAFVAAAIFKEGMSKPDSLLARALEGVSFAVLGGEEAGARAHFNEALLRLFPGSDTAMDTAQLAASVLAAGLETIQFATQGEPAMAGRVQYRVLRRGQPAETGFFDS